MVRWGQTRIDAEALKTAIGVFRPDLYDAALGRGGGDDTAAVAPFTAFAGPIFDPADIAGYLASFAVARRAS
jgi:two-component system, oxyanion-binding sensor